MNKAAVIKFLFWATFFLFTLPIANVHAEAIKIGVILPLSGKLVKYGEIEHRSLLMAADEINSAGGIKDRPIHLLVEDTKGDPSTGWNVTKKLIEKNSVCLIVGGISSSVTWEAAKIAQHNKVPFLVTSASADRITEKGGSYIFRISAPVTEYYEAISSFLNNIKNIKTIGVIYENSFYGQSRLKELIRLTKRTKQKITIKEAFEIETSDFTQPISRIKSIGPDLFYMITGVTKHAALIIRTAGELGYNAKLYMSDGSVFSRPDFQIMAEGYSEYIIATTPWTTSVNYPNVDNYAMKYIKAYGETTDYHGAQAYAAMQVVIDALERAESFGPSDVKDALGKTEKMTVFGPVKFISYGRKKQQNRIPVLLGQWLKNEFQSIWPKNLAKRHFIYPIPKWESRAESADHLDWDRFSE